MEYGAGSFDLLATDDLYVVNKLDAVHHNPNRRHRAYFKSRIGLEQTA
jgi:hypothetical protein